MQRPLLYQFHMQSPLWSMKTLHPWLIQWVHSSCGVLLFVLFDQPLRNFPLRDVVFELLLLMRFDLPEAVEAAI